MCMTCANEIWYFKIWMFCAVEEDKMISGTEHTITETNKTKFQHTSGCLGLQTGRKPIVSLYSTNVLVVPRVISLIIQFSMKNYASYNNQFYFTTDDKKLELFADLYSIHLQIVITIWIFHIFFFFLCRWQRCSIVGFNCVLCPLFCQEIPTDQVNWLIDWLIDWSMTENVKWMWNT